MIYIRGISADPYFNLAMEEYVFRGFSPDQDYFLLWQNDNAVIVGKHQNTIEEINPDYVKEHRVKVVRRMSGGGAVYHDLGNLNFTFIVHGRNLRRFDFRVFTEPVVKALGKMGIEAESTGRNDITIQGKKFSGNSQYIGDGGLLHHGTLLFDSDLSVLGQALNPKKEKIESKSIKSVRSRVTNIAEHLKTEHTIKEFEALLLKYMLEDEELSEYYLTEHDIAEINRLAGQKYATWEWNYGASPKYNLRKERKFESMMLTIFIQVEQGRIDHIKFYGDFFGNGRIEEIEDKLTGINYEQESIKKALKNLKIDDYFRGIDSVRLADAILY